MTWSGSDIVVIAARRPVAVALQAVLHDWMVQGLVNPCRIVDLDSMVDGQPAIPSTVLEAGAARTAAVSSRRVFAACNRARRSARPASGYAFFRGRKPGRLRRR